VVFDEGAVQLLVLFPETFDLVREDVRPLRPAVVGVAVVADGGDRALQVVALDVPITGVRGRQARQSYSRITSSDSVAMT
jgi:hypothetical protein